MDEFEIPAALKPYATWPRWVVWRKEPGKSGKPTKVPYQPHHPTWKAKSDDSKTWSNLATAIEVAERDGFDGIGLELHEGELGAFDLDHCRNLESGEIEPKVMELVARCGSYTEITPSKTGLRVIGLYMDEPKQSRKAPLPGARNGVTIEPYPACERFVTVTGDHLDGTPTELADITHVMDEVLAELDALYPRSKSKGDWDPGDFTGDGIEADDPRLGGLGPDWIELGTKATGVAEKYKGDRSRAAFAFACECVRCGIADDVIASCLTHWKIGEHIHDQHDAERSLKRTIVRAHQFVADSKLFKMNEQHCVLPINGKTRVATWGEDPNFPGHSTITMFSSFGDFTSLHNKYRHRYQENGETKTVKLGTWWLGNPARRQYDGGMKFAPTCDEDVINGNTLNLWMGFNVPARKPEGKSGAAGCQLLLDHGLKVICSGNEQHYDYLIKREAFIAQRRTRSEVGVGLQTEVEGTGKGMWSRELNYLYGHHAMEILNPDHIVGKHNPHLEKLLRLTADEALFVHNHQHRNALYNLITEPRITIEPKFVNAYQADSHLNIDIISNKDHFLPVSGSARRFFIPTVSSEHANDHEYFSKIIAQQRDEGGAAALLYHLTQEVDIRDFNPRAVPKTAMLAEQAQYSRSGVDLLVETACHTAHVPCQHIDLHDLSVSSGYEQHTGFDYFIDHHADRDLARMGSLTVKRRLAKWGCITGKASRKQQEGSRAHGVLWPSLPELRKRFEEKYGPQSWMTDAEEWQPEHF